MDIDLRFTHVGLFVQDVEAMGAFYRDVLGFTETDRGELGDHRLIFLSRDPEEHHQIVFVSGLTAAPAQEIVNQLSFRVRDLESLLRFHADARKRDLDDLQSVNHGNAWSIYFRDPEGNRIEVYTPSPWYVSQPCRVPLAIDQTAEQIRTQTQEWCRLQPGYAPASEFAERLAAKIRRGSGADPASPETQPTLV